MKESDRLDYTFVVSHSGFVPEDVFRLSNSLEICSGRGRTRESLDRSLATSSTDVITGLSLNRTLQFACQFGSAQSDVQSSSFVPENMRHPDVSTPVSQSDVRR